MRSASERVQGRDTANQDFAEESCNRHNVAGKERVHIHHECFLPEKDVIGEVLNDFGDQDQSALDGRVVLRQFDVD